MSGAARWGPASQQLWDPSMGWVLSTRAQSCSTGAQQAEQGSDSNRSWWQPSEPQVNSRLHAGSKVNWGNPGDNSGAGLGPCTPTLQLWQGLKPQCWAAMGFLGHGQGCQGGWAGPSRTVSAPGVLTTIEGVRPLSVKSTNRHMCSILKQQCQQHIIS